MKMVKNLDEIVCVAGANMQWGNFVCPSSSQKKESTAFDLILRVGKGTKFGVEKVNGDQNICSRVANVVNGKNCEKQP